MNISMNALLLKDGFIHNLKMQKVSSYSRKTDGLVVTISLEIDGFIVLTEDSNKDYFSDKAKKISHNIRETLEDCTNIIDI